MRLKHGQQKIIAAAAGIDSSYVSHILSGRKRPTWQTAKKLTQATGVKYELWFEGSPEELKAALAAKELK